MKRHFLTLLGLGIGLGLAAQTAAGGIDDAMMTRLRQSYAATPADRAISNALRNAEIDVLAANADNRNNFDDNFSHKVKTRGITNQKSSGRCWLFTGLNVLRAQMIDTNGLPELELSQNYNFFYDQLEKANLFLQAIIDTSALPADDRTVEWLLQHPVSDGGQYTGFSHNIMKYGVVPKGAMVETVSSSKTAAMRKALSTLLRKDALRLRSMAAAKATDAQMAAEKETMLADVYRVLALNLGVPPTQFTYTRKDKDKNIVSSKTYTPREFYAEMAGQDLAKDYVMLMNDPSREYFKVYEIDLDRHAYDAGNWTYLNLPADIIKQIAIASIKDNTAMYFSCDVAKYLNRDNGTLDLDNYDYGSLLGVDLSMDKADRIRTGDSASSHAMTLMAVDLDADGKPVKWMVENSWGPGANDGHLIMTDSWFDEYMFRLVADRKYIPAKYLKMLEQTPVVLPAWDIMY